MATKFFVCTTCGNVVVKFVDSGVTPFCCGKAMVELIPGTSDGAVEKHLPVVESVGKHTIRVNVGEMPHPMMAEHHISFIYLETPTGGQIKYLKPGEPAEAVFCNVCEKPVAVYSYCNIHGLWKAELH